MSENRYRQPVPRLVHEHAGPLFEVGEQRRSGRAARRTREATATTVGHRTTGVALTGAASLTAGTSHAAHAAVGGARLGVGARGAAERLPCRATALTRRAAPAAAASHAAHAAVQGSVWNELESLQPMPHTTCAPGQVATHLEAEQYGVAPLHIVPQAPQFFPSEARSAQAPVHAVSPPWH